MRRSLGLFIISVLSVALLFAPLTYAAGEYDNEETIKQVQEALNEAGYDCGTPDGVAGDKTKSAIERYKSDQGMDDTSNEITFELLLALGIKETPVELTDGFYRKVADKLDPMISLSATSDTLYIERDYGDEEGLDHISDFFEIVCKMIHNVSVWKDYTGLDASFIAKDTLEMISVSGIEGVNEFTTVYFGPLSKDPNVQVAFPLFYKGVFGAHDNSIRSEKGMNDITDEYFKTKSEVPEDYRNGRFWVFSCFDSDTCKIVNIDDTVIELEILDKNTKYAGWRIRKDIDEALELFLYLINNDPDSMPYTRLIIKTVDVDNPSQTLFALDLEKKGMSFEPNLNKVYVNPYAEGIIAYQNGETVEEESESSAQSAESEIQTEESGTEGAQTEQSGVEESSSVESPTETEAELQTENVKDFTIQFRGIPWYSKRSEAEETLLSEGSNVVGSLGLPNQMDDLRSAFILDYTLQDVEYAVDGAGYRGWYHEMEVAGYTPTFVWAYYLYPIKDGVMDKNDDESEFYFAYYEFQAGEFSDYDAIFNDLGEKLKTLYKEPEELESDYFTVLKWTDNDDNMIVLSKLKGENENVKLAYLAGGAYEKLIEAKSVIEAEALDAENAAREANADNTSGL